jgi:hypothetical protein
VDDQSREQHIFHDFYQWICSHEFTAFIKNESSVIEKNKGVYQAMNYKKQDQKKTCKAH